MNRIKKEPFVPEVIDDESLISYIYRLSKVNDHEITWIYELLGMNASKIRRKGFQLGKEIIDTSILAEFTGIDQHVLDNLSLNIKNSVPEIQNKIDLYAIRTIKKQFCPVCLNEKKYYRKIWDLSIYTRCHTHNCLLLCSCTICSRSITTQDIINDFCKCGYRLSSNLSVRCESSDLGYLLSKKKENFIDFNERKSTFEEFRNLEIDLLIYLILFLSFNISRIFYQRRVAFSESKNLIFCDKVVDEAYNIFTNWPQSFYRFLDNFKIIPRHNRSGGMNVHFGGFHQQINKLSMISDFAFFTDEYKNYIRNIWSGKDGKKGLFITNISLSQACKLLGANKKSVSTLISEGLIEAKTVYWWKQKLILIDRLSLENYKKYLEISYLNNSNKIKNDIAKNKGYITVAEAAKKLETSRTSIIKLVKGHSIREGRKILIQEGFVDNLNDLIKNKSEMFSDELELINFYHAQKYFIRITKRTLKDFYKFIFEKEFQSFVKPDKIGFEKIFFNKTQFIQKLSSEYDEQTD